MNKNQSAVDGSRFCQVSDTDSIQLQSEEPAVTRWRVSATDELVAHLLSLVGTPQGRPAIIAVDRSLPRRTSLPPGRSHLE